MLACRRMILSVQVHPPSHTVQFSQDSVELHANCRLAGPTPDQPADHNDVSGDEMPQLRTADSPNNEFEERNVLPKPLDVDRPYSDVGRRLIVVKLGQEPDRRQQHSLLDVFIALGARVKTLPQHMAADAMTARNSRLVPERRDRRIRRYVAP